MMFGLFSRKKGKRDSVIDFAALGADMHSHLLPGIDDGAPDMETSLELIRGLQDLGYKKIVTTPHILWDMYKNTPEIINEKLGLVRKALKENDIDIEIHAAAEYFLDDHMAQLIHNKEPLLTVKDNWVLVEFSVMHMSINMKEILFDLQVSGYQPILAHPERYAYLSHDRGIFDELKSNGVYFQLNLLSVSGNYGRTVMELSQHFLKKGYYDLVGTDMHHIGHLERLRNLKIPADLQELMESGRLLNSQL